ncbi:uncharacterized mitochondrial protein AtMg00860-like [Teleopsis dalmanni]|uniref:uncharacterized mitochondrial protein AtMg00860-like n=1 Tax=Teleopsis dalmanni TaxID=139649 RepID=UPI0018CF9F08|nr:uncharacterized mitochondrial protein AtMg00860-like [Teleopsis dalmanni]
MMMKLMEPLKGKVVSYVDEVIVASETAQEGLENLEEFLKIIRHEVDENGIKPGITKTIAIKQFSIPTNVTEVRRFLGLTGYFRKFVQNYAQIAHPLTQLTRKNIAFKWSSESESAFLKLIELLANEPLLGKYDI